jgi:hypothetical protein
MEPIGEAKQEFVPSKSACQQEKTMSQPQKCQACGASVYPEHIDEGRAGRLSGQLLCTVCYAEKKAEQATKAAAPAAAAAPVATDAVAAMAGQPAATPGGARPAAPPPLHQPAGNEEEPISLVDAAPESGSQRIQTFGQAKIHQQREFTRKTSVTGQGATRVKSFHAKIQAESIEFMDDAINLWLDEHPEVEVKFATTTVGTMVGKFPEPNIIINIWY